MSIHLLLGKDISIEDFVREVEFPFFVKPTKYHTTYIPKHIKNRDTNHLYEGIFTITTRFLVDKNISYDGDITNKAIYVVGYSSDLDARETKKGYEPLKTLDMFRTIISRAAEDLYQKKPKIAEKLARFDDQGKVEYLYCKCVFLGEYDPVTALASKPYLGEPLRQTDAYVEAPKSVIFPGKTKKTD